MRLVQVAFEEATVDGLFDAELFAFAEESPGNDDHDGSAHASGDSLSFQETQDHNRHGQRQEADSGDDVCDGVHDVSAFRVLFVDECSLKPDIWNRRGAITLPTAFPVAWPGGLELPWPGLQRGLAAGDCLTLPDS